MVAVDINKDQNIDIIVANSGSNNIGVLLNTGTGSFESQVTYSVGNDPHSLFASDVNYDGKLDIVTANSDSNTVSVLLYK